MGSRSTVFAREPWINTIIGGVAGTISSKSALATKLGIYESIIKRFEIVGSDVHAHISSNYSIGGKAFTSSTDIVFYNDLGGMVITVSTGAFRYSSLQWFNLPSATYFWANSMSNCTSLVEANFPMMVEMGQFQGNTSCKKIIAPQIESINPTDNINGMFTNVTSLELFDMKKLKVLSNNPSGINSVYRGGLTACTVGCVFKVHVIMRNNNAGGAQYVWQYLKTNKSAVIEFYDDDGNYVSTL